MGGFEAFVVWFEEVIIRRVMSRREVRSMMNKESMDGHSVH